MMSEHLDEAVIGCRLLEWDSSFFGLRIARAEPSVFRAGSEPLFDAWCSLNQIECVYLLADVADQSTITSAESAGFRLVDIRLTLETTLSQAAPAAAVGPAHGTVRAACPDDLKVLKAIARQSHRETRFYADGHFDPRRCDDMYETWIQRSCGGWAERVVVAEVDGVPAGYVTCHVRGPEEGQIGLVAVKPGSRGLGLGSVMIDEALRWFVSQHMTRVSVITQARNANAGRFYQRAGFSVTSIQLWYHKWMARSRS
jgi:dTDP-4-amino-4,6-dideoxy-D-galactose acyltransferase